MDPIHDLSNSFFYLFVPLIKYLIIKERSQKKDGEDLERESNDMTELINKTKSINQTTAMP